jgi:hypothetical protein
MHCFQLSHDYVVFNCCTTTICACTYDTVHLQTIYRLSSRYRSKLVRLPACLPGFSTPPQTPTFNLKQPPVIPTGLAGKYAGALFSAASKQSSKTLTQVESDLGAIQKLIKSTPEVATFLANPTLAASEKQKGMKDLMDRIGANSSEYTKNFLNVLAENGRLYETEKTIEGFQQIMSAYRGELEITISCE